ncbi:hypothetical protein C1645_824240 [Glomus cerebriforme]|uniref:Myb/SANT-like domain-containing protein n=1 Tax=Glomus cerebriforme TaxID=658196 RepID=A0A397SXU5_9GLOM|nr:hypothetical protein C1645_824240 [Glomus cerebriforme]
MSSIEWADSFLLMNENKEILNTMLLQIRRNISFGDIAGKINEQENTNYFTGEDCHKKFLSLTKAFYTAKKYREGTWSKRSLVGEKLYEEFSTKFWLKPELPFKQTRNESIRSSDMVLLQRPRHLQESLQSLTRMVEF